MSATRPRAPASVTRIDRLDPGSRRWLEELRQDHPRHDAAVARLHEMLTRVAVHELSRRRSQLLSVSGPEFDDLVHQAAGDALVSVLSRLDDFKGLSRFSTWAYGFVIFELSTKVARHAWHRQSPGLTEQDVEMASDRQPESLNEQLEHRAQLQVLAGAIEELTPRQRDAFVAVALNDVSIDVVALRLQTNRNAVYKNLFDARQALRRKLAAAGLPLHDGVDRPSEARHASRSPPEEQQAICGAA